MLCVLHILLALQNNHKVLHKVLDCPQGLGSPQGLGRQQGLGSTHGVGSPQDLGSPQGFCRPTTHVMYVYEVCAESLCLAGEH